MGTEPGTRSHGQGGDQVSILLRLSTPRLEKAVERVGLKDGSISVFDLRKALTKRGMSDRDMHAMFHRIITVLEPPSCYMSHCKHFGGGGSPMNCQLERVPGRCQILKEYKIRKADREAKAEAEKQAPTKESK